MGYYIEVPNNKGKAKQLIDLYGAEITSRPLQFKDIPDGKGLICVVENRQFDAAGYCYSSREMDAFMTDYGPQGQRPRLWLYMDKNLAEKLSGFRR